jgi:hypothetical protein
VSGRLPWRWKRHCTPDSRLRQWLDGSFNVVSLVGIQDGHQSPEHHESIFEPDPPSSRPRCFFRLAS